MGGGGGGGGGVGGNQTMSDPAKIRRGCEISQPLRNFLEKLFSLLQDLSTALQNNTRKSNKK